MKPLTTDQVEQFNEQGYVVVENVLDDGTVDTLRAALDELETRPEDDESVSRGGATSSPSMDCHYNRDPCLGSCNSDPYWRSLSNW